MDHPKDQPLCLVAYTSREGIFLVGAQPAQPPYLIAHLLVIWYGKWSSISLFFAHREAQPSCFSII